MQQKAISNKKRISALLVVLLFVASTILSTAFVIKTANHHRCNHADCQICQTMQLCIKRLTDLGSKTDESESLSVSLYLAVFILPFVCYTVSRKTLIDLKTKLSN